MLSARRMLSIFCQRGGADYANLTEKLTSDQIAFLKRVTGNELIIAMMSSEDEWFALTKSHLVLNSGEEFRRAGFDEIRAVTISERYRRDVRNFQHIKTSGGYMDVELRDGTTLEVKVEPGGPYLGLMNVLMRIATINRRRNLKVGNRDGNIMPMTDDERPTTQL